MESLVVILIAGIFITSLELLRMWIMNRLRAEAVKRLKADAERK